VRARRVRVNLIHKCFISRDVFTLIHAFKVYARPIFEYVSLYPTWSARHILQRQQVENVYTKEIHQATSCYRPMFHYATRRGRRVLNLDLDSLDMRRLRHDLL